MEEVRVDKWLWAVRIFKSRTLAVEACKKNRVMIDNISVKASRTIKVGDVVQVRKPPVIFSFKVLKLADKRMGAKLVPEFMENVTSPDQYEILELNKISGFDSATFVDDTSKTDTTTFGKVISKANNGTDNFVTTKRSTQAEQLMETANEYWSKEALYRAMLADACRDLTLPLYEFDD